MKQPVISFTKPQPPIIVEKILPDVIWRIPNNERRVFLTFDDGPVPQYTEEVLNILDSYSVKATFFCVGHNVEKHPDIFKEIIKRGHSVGQHTHNHFNGWFTVNKSYYSNILKATTFINSSLFRPPYGKIKISQSKNLSKKYHIIMWDVLSKDYDQEITPQECLKNVTDYVNSGSIIVFHDSAKAKNNWEYALPKTIEYLLENNFVPDKIHQTDLISLK